MIKYKSNKKVSLSVATGIVAMVFLVGCPASYVHILEADEDPLPIGRHLYKSELSEQIEWSRSSIVRIIIPKSDTATFYKFKDEWYGGWDTINIQTKEKFDSFSLKHKDYKIEIIRTGLFSAHSEYYHCAECHKRYGWNKYGNK